MRRIEERGAAFNEGDKSKDCCLKASSSRLREGKIERLEMEIRPYQQEAIDAIMSARARGVSRQLVVLPTGCGKTICFVTLAKQLNVPTLIIAHREELIRQAADKVSIVWPEADVGIVMADADETHTQVVVASIQTACRDKRLETLKSCGFQLLIIDEAHHSVSESYRKLIKELGFLDGNPQKLLVGVTATATRADGQGLGDIFEEIVFERSLPTMVKAGYLSDIKGKRILTQTDLSGIKTRYGDFVESELAHAVNTPHRNELIVEGYKKNASRRKAVAFCVDVAHSKDLAQTFLDKGISAAPVYGAMPDVERKEMLKRFSKGELQVLCNCNLLTEGYDEPSISCILMARPTKSLGLYAQCVGRGTRLHPGKKNCLVIDFTDSAHDISNIASLETAVFKPLDETKETAERQDTVKIDRGPRKLFVENDVVEDFDLFERSNFAWVQIKENWLLEIFQVKIWLEANEDGYMPYVQLPDQTIRLSSRPLPLGYAQGSAEDWLRKNKHYANVADKDAVWRKDPATPKQIETLERMGIKTDFQNLSKGDAFLLIGKKVNEQSIWKSQPPTPQQLYFLRANGIQSKPATKGEAMRIIARLKEQKMAVR